MKREVLKVEFVTLEYIMAFADLARQLLGCRHKLSENNGLEGGKNGN